MMERTSAIPRAQNCSHVLIYVSNLRNTGEKVTSQTRRHETFILPPRLSVCPHFFSLSSFTLLDSNPICCCHCVVATATPPVQ